LLMLGSFHQGSALLLIAGKREFVCYTGSVDLDAVQAENAWADACVQWSICPEEECQTMMQNCEVVYLPVDALEFAAARAVSIREN
jgi:hypothetical protein